MIAHLLLFSAAVLPMLSPPVSAANRFVDPGRTRANGSAEQAAQKPLPDGNRLVQVALLSDHSAVRAGETFTLGVRLTIEPKWHIYWQNQGDAGVPTKVEIHAPKGFEVGAVHYPAPEREESEGDIVSYVYTHEVVLLLDVKAPKDLPVGAKLDFSVDSRWLVCTTLCLPGAGKASLELIGAAASEPAHLAHEAEFKDWRAKLPRPYEELLAIAGFHADEFTDWKKPIALMVPGALALDFYAYIDDPITLNVAGLQLQRTDGGCTMTLKFEPPAGFESASFGIRGVVAVRTTKGEAYYHIGFGRDAEPAGVASSKKN